MFELEVVDEWTLIKLISVTSLSSVLPRPIRLGRAQRGGARPRLGLGDT